MANEITKTVNLSINNGTFQVSKIGLTQQVSQSVQGGGGPGAVTIPTTAGGTVIDTSGLALHGLCYIKNLDLQNTLSIGPEDTGAIVPFMDLKAGEDYVIRLTPGVTWRAIAAVAPILVQVNAYED